MKDGGPAFPLTPEVVIDGQSIKETQGMTLRDYLAAHIVSGILSNPNLIHLIGDAGQKWVATVAYEQADAMLEAKEDR